MIQPPPPPPSPPVTARTELAYAGFWRRVLAYLMDGLILAAIGSIVTLGVYSVAPNDLQSLANISPVSTAIAWAYFAVLESSPMRATLGKLALDLVVGDKHGDPITFWRASARYYLKILSWLTLGTGFILAGFTPRKQALHDVLAGTVVLRRVHFLVIGEEPPTEPGEYWDGKRWIATVSPMTRTEP